LNPEEPLGTILEHWNKNNMVVWSSAIDAQEKRQATRGKIGA
jgi:hypothetical protein